METRIPSMETEEPPKSTPNADERAPYRDRGVQDDAVRICSAEDGNVPPPPRTGDGVPAVAGSP